MQSKSPVALHVLDASELAEAVEEYLRQKRPEVLEKATGHSFEMDCKGRVRWAVLEQVA